MESQKTDPNSRPYAEVKVMNCGELVPKSKGLFAMILTKKLRVCGRKSFVSLQIYPTAALIFFPSA